MSKSKRQIKNPLVNKGERIRVSVSSEESPQNQSPLFSFRYLQEGYRVSDCQRDDQAALAKRLEILGKTDWATIQSAPRHGIGSEKIERDSLAQPIPSSLSEDVVFLALRFSGMKAMIGFRDGVIFHIVWLDHSYDVYSHG